MKILSEIEMDQLQEIGYISINQLHAMLKNGEASEEEMKKLHEELANRGVPIIETAPPQPSRRPQSAVADPGAESEAEELNS